MILGIDASNIRGGGGVTHLVELLKVATPQNYGFSKVYVWGGKNTLDKIEDRSWLQKVNEPSLNKSLPYRVYWQKFILNKRAKSIDCNILFVPGSSYTGNFRPYVTLSQNMLPFEIKEIKRYGLSWQLIRLVILRFLQSKTFKKADGVIFLTSYAQNRILEVIGKIRGLTEIIPHGIDLNFSEPVKTQNNITSYSKENPFRILYVSMIDIYKHQENVCSAVVSLCNMGFNVRLDLIGPAYLPALKKLRQRMKMLRIKENNYPIYYQGSVPHEQLNEWYKNADLFVFASSCENMPIILMEAMIAGLPIASSNLGPMPEVLKKNGLYFNPYDSFSIFQAIEKLLKSRELRAEIAHGSYESVKYYSWQECSNKTFEFFERIIKQKREQNGNIQ